MSDPDPRIDAYIAKSADFAQPILRHLRSLVREACPQVRESIKWGAPSFGHAGGILCGMAAFKRHVSFGFWKHALVMGEGVERDGMGSFGKMVSLSDVPSKKAMIVLIRKAMRLNEQGVKTPATRKTAGPRAPLEIPEDLLVALNRNRTAKKDFRRFQSQRPSRVRGMGSRSQARGNPAAPHRPGGRVDGGRQATQLEISELLRAFVGGASAPMLSVGFRQR